MITARRFDACRLSLFYSVICVKRIQSEIRSMPEACLVAVEIKVSYDDPP